MSPRRYRFHSSSDGRMAHDSRNLSETLKPHIVRANASDTVPPPTYECSALLGLQSLASLSPSPKPRLFLSWTVSMTAACTPCTSRRSGAAYRIWQHDIPAEN